MFYQAAAHGVDANRMKEGLNRRTVHELKDGTYHSDDVYAVEIHKRRMKNEADLKNEMQRLEAEADRFNSPCLILR